MGWLAHVEGSNGDKLTVLLSDGHIGGKAFLAFYIPLLNYCDDIAEGGDGTCDGEFSDLKWFESLSINTQSLCEIATVFKKCVYTGEWDYHVSEFERYVRCTNDNSTTEETFIAAVKHAQNAWSEIDVVREKVAILVEALRSLNLANTFFYEAPYTLNDFVALLETIEILHQRKVERIRINIS